MRINSVGGELGSYAWGYIGNNAVTKVHLKLGTDKTSAVFTGILVVEAMAHKSLPYFYRYFRTILI